MPTVKYIQNNLTSGVFSKKMHGRLDLARYYNAVDTLQNWLSQVQGGITRRPGFHFVDYPKYSDGSLSGKKCRLIPFEYGITQAYVIEVGDQYMRFIKDGALIRLESGSDLITNGTFPATLTGWTDYSVAPGTVVQDTGTAKLTTVGAADSGPIQINVDSGVKTFTRLTGSFVTDGFAVGQTITTFGFTDTGNNTTKIIDTVTALVITVTSGTGLVTETGTGDEKILTEISIGSLGQSIATVSGKTYILRFDVITDDIYLRVGTSAQGTQILNDVVVAPGLQRQATFIARGTTTYIQFLRKADGSAKTDNVACKLYDPVELTTSPYLEADLPDLKWAQDSNDLYITHPSYWPRKITRSSDTVWTITTIDNTQFIDGPYFTEQKTPTITPSALTGNITLVASAPLWDTSTPSKHIGALWRFGWYYWIDGTIGYAWRWGCVRITSVENSTHAHATVLPDWPLYLPSAPPYGASTVQREGRWSTLRGFPRSVVFHEGRLTFGGSPTSPQSFFGSVSDDPYKMSPSDLKGIIIDSNAILFTIGSTKVNLIRWMITANGLVLGTNGGVFRATASPITPTNINLVNEATEGVDVIQGIRIGPSIIIIERSSSQVLELTYNYSSDSYESQDLSVLADELVSDGITDMAFQGGMNPTLWFVKTNGEFLALVYRRNEKVASWSEHETDGEVECFAVIPNPTERDETVYAIVNRTIDGVPIRTIEYLDPYLNVDCALSANFGSPVSILSGLEHLIGEIVDIVGDDAVYPQALVDENGQVEINPSASNIEVGLHYDAYLKTLKPEIKSEQNTIQPCKKRWSQIWVRLVDTVGLTLNGETLPFRSSLDLMDAGIAPFTGDKEMFNLGWEDDGVITIEQKLPLPATVLCYFGTLEIN